MAIVQCKNNHYYDGEKYTQCPHCVSGMAKNDLNEGVTVPMGDVKVEEYFAQYVKSHPSEEMDDEKEQRDMDEGKTVALVAESKKNVCGWLVCIKGPERGKDFKLYQGFNLVGRDHDNDIVLGSDRQVARKEQCRFVYEDRKNQFFVVPEAGSLTYVNDELLEKPRQLADGDVIYVGECDLVFVPFCKGDLRW